MQNYKIVVIQYMFWACLSVLSVNAWSSCELDGQSYDEGTFINTQICGEDGWIKTVVPKSDQETLSEPELEDDSEIVVDPEKMKENDLASKLKPEKEK